MRVVNLGLFRPNLQLLVDPITSDAEKQQHLLHLAEERAGLTMVYCATVQHVNALAMVLARAGHAVARYHGSLAARVRHAEQERFMQGEAAIMVSTNAFGMGIDKPDVRLVVHYDMPGSLDAYYQEAGRADRRLQRFFLADAIPRPSTSIS